MEEGGRKKEGCTKEGCMKEGRRKEERRMEGRREEKSDFYKTVKYNNFFPFSSIFLRIGIVLVLRNANKISFSDF